MNPNFDLDWCSRSVCIRLFFVLNVFAQVMTILVNAVGKFLAPKNFAIFLIGGKITKYRNEKV